MKFSNGFSNNPFMMGYDSTVFEEDDELGFRFPDGKIIIHKDFVHLKEIMNSIYVNDTIILNMGDSSTSGWNSNSVTKGTKDPKAPFFSYKTYSQIIHEKGKCRVINAGVPGYSNLQGKKYLQKLLKEFSKNNILIDYVTIYFGNNDSTYNLHEDKIRLEGKKASQSNKIGFRVTVEDFKKNIAEMIEICKEYGATPILIIPPVNFDWKPGVRSQLYEDEFVEALDELPESEAKRYLLQAIELHKLGEYHRAKELDLVLPRIKQNYIETLRNIAEEKGVKIIDVQEQIPNRDTSEYFVDYCHPLEKVNLMVVEELLKHINVKEKINVKDTNQNENFTLPYDTYTLY